MACDYMRIFTSRARVIAMATLQKGRSVWLLGLLSLSSSSMLQLPQQVLMQMATCLQNITRLYSFKPMFFIIKANSEILWMLHGLLHGTDYSLFANKPRIHHAIGHRANDAIYRLK